MDERFGNFGEHLEDLRLTLIKSISVVGLGFLLLLAFYQPIFQFLTAPLSQSHEEGVSSRNLRRIHLVNRTGQDKIVELPPHSWIEIYTEPLPEKLKGNTYRLAPGQSLIYEEPIESPLLILGPADGLLLVMKASFWLSFALTAPFWGWFWVQFIMPGLRAGERSFAIPLLLASFVSLSLGIAFAYFITLPIANQYLLHFNHSIGQNAWTLTHYVNYALLLCTGHGVAGELALVLFLAVHFRLLTVASLIAKRRYMIVLAFVIGALLTPPDVFTQLLLAIPLIGLYESAILYAKWLDKGCDYLTFT